METFLIVAGITVVIALFLLSAELVAYLDVKAIRKARDYRRCVDQNLAIVNNK